MISKWRSVNSTTVPRLANIPTYIYSVSTAKKSKSVLFPSSSSGIAQSGQIGTHNKHCLHFSSKKIGFLDTLNMNENDKVDAYYTIAEPNNAGKDTLNGHYEMMGITNNIEFKTFKLSTILK